MCLLCDQVADRHLASRYQIGPQARLGSAYIETQYLIDQDSADFTHRVTATDSVLDYYMHIPGGAVQVSGGDFGTQIIRSLEIPPADQAFLRSTINRVDNLIDLDFQEVNSSVLADVDLYYDSEIDPNASGSGQTLGLAITSGSNWELFVNKPQLENDKAYRHYVLLHEFGHALGLEHPFEDSDGDVFNGITDPWTSAYPENTVMAYRSPSEGSWPDFYTQNDVSALQSIWGKESRQATDSHGSINTSQPTQVIINDYARDLVNGDLTGSPQFSYNSFDSKFYNLGEGRYGVQKKGESTIDEITGVTSLQFADQALSLAEDVAATFNQVKGIDDVSGVVFRLYNAAFARLPDANGLENWINGNSSGGMTYATSAQEFSTSQEFKNRYGANTTDTQYITTLYSNVLERSPDAAGLSHYQGLLANGKERGALLLDFSESPENRVLFTQVTGLS